ncbi:MAG: uracil-DNA glycosylase [Candidatus Melainabacteria bacterium]|nr:uracil-DNA glycosylase [Candidatus Melainabacteria bacterium]
MILDKKVPGALRELTDRIVACRRCPRLVQYREMVARQKRAAYKHETYWGKPLPGFGDPQARLLIVGLAPAAHGGNRTGRMFTGDSSGNFLMRGLNKYGFANLPDSISSDDGLQLQDAYILAIVRCAPPDNKPLPSEVVNCRQFLLEESALLPNIQAVLALGKVAFDGYLNALVSHGLRFSKPLFKHGAQYELMSGLPRLFTSYHPSRQNTQTGRLTEEMFNDVLEQIRAFLCS